MIDPKVSAWINIVILVISALTGASAQWTSLFGQGVGQEIVAIAGLVGTVLAAVNAALHGVSAPVPGPLVKS